MDNTDTLLDCGLGFTCSFNKPGGFIGQDYLLSQRETANAEGGFRKRMASVLVDDPQPLLCHGEVLWRNGERINDLRSASYGHTLGGAVGLTMLESSEPLTKDYLKSGDWQLEIADKRYPCSVSFAPFYDPKNKKIKV